MVSLAIDFFLALEQRVWAALIEGDMKADESLLDAGFIGLYATGFASRDDHIEQLRNGPTVQSYSIHDPRLLPLAEDTVLLAYRATFTPTAAPTPGGELTWYVSSIWKQRERRWLNVFSQDTKVVPAS